MWLVLLYFPALFFFLYALNADEKPVKMGQDELHCSFQKLNYLWSTNSFLNQVRVAAIHHMGYTTGLILYDSLALSLQALWKVYIC